jgi:hypothetical protein
MACQCLGHVRSVGPQFQGRGNEGGDIVASGGASEVDELHPVAMARRCISGDGQRQ